MDTLTRDAQIDRDVSRPREPVCLAREPTPYLVQRTIRIRVVTRMPISKLLTTLGVPAALLVLMTALAGCEPPRAAAAPPAPPQVTVAKPAKRLVADRDE